MDWTETGLSESGHVDIYKRNTPDTNMPSSEVKHKTVLEAAVRKKMRVDEAWRRE